MHGDSQEKAHDGARQLPAWARWVLYALVFGGTAAAFYLNFGRVIERLGN